MAGPNSGSTDRMGSSESRLSQLRSCASLAILGIREGAGARGGGWAQAQQRQAAPVTICKCANAS